MLPLYGFVGVMTATSKLSHWDNFDAAEPDALLQVFQLDVHRTDRHAAGGTTRKSPGRSPFCSGTSSKDPDFAGCCPESGVFGRGPSTLNQCKMATSTAASKLSHWDNFDAAGPHGLLPWLQVVWPGTFRVGAAAKIGSNATQRAHDNGPGRCSRAERLFAGAPGVRTTGQPPCCNGHNLAGRRLWRLLHPAEGDQLLTLRFSAASTMPQTPAPQRGVSASAFRIAVSQTRVGLLRWLTVATFRGGVRVAVPQTRIRRRRWATDTAGPFRVAIPQTRKLPGLFAQQFQNHRYHTIPQRILSPQAVLGGDCKTHYQEKHQCHRQSKTAHNQLLAEERLD